jgi:hypothetical protein
MPSPLPFAFRQAAHRPPAMSRNALSRQYPVCAPARAAYGSRIFFRDARDSSVTFIVPARYSRRGLTPAALPAALNGAWQPLPPVTGSDPGPTYSVPAFTGASQIRRLCVIRIPHRSKPLPVNDLGRAGVRPRPPLQFIIGQPFGPPAGSDPGPTYSVPAFTGASQIRRQATARAAEKSPPPEGGGLCTGERATALSFRSSG